MHSITRKALAVLMSVMLLCVMLPMAVTADSALISVDFEGGQPYFASDCDLAVTQDGGSNVLYWDAAKADWANIYVYTSIEANADYQVTFKIKANMASALMIKFLAPDWMSAYAQANAAATTEWTTVDVTLNSATGGTAVFMIQTGLPASSGQKLYVDDVVVTKKSGSTTPDTPDTPNEPYVPVDGNYIQNGAFETGDATSWQFHQSTQVSSAAAYTGSYGLQVIGNGGWGGLGNQTITGLTAGKVYRFSLYYKSVSNGVNVKLCNGSTDKGETYAHFYHDNKPEWTELAVEFEALSDTAFFTLVGAGNNLATEVHIDDITLTEVVLGGEDDDPNLKMIDTLLDDIKTQGRTALVRGTLMLDFTVSGMEFELDCSGDVYATFNASKISNSAANGGVYFTIYVDGVKLARDYCRIASVGETKVKLASDLPAGKHTFAIYRQSEHSFGEVGVCALSYDGEMLDKPADKDLYIEFIGDSISCGYGNIGTSGDALSSDGTQAYTFITAQALNADWSTVSWSGLGCKYGYSTTTMQDVYPAQRYNYDQTTQYSFAKQPDIVVLALGTNDNSIQSDATLKRAGLVEMLQLVRAKNPDAPIVWIHNMMTDGVSAMIEDIVAEFGGAEAGYYACRLTRNNAGGGSHPSLAGQQTFADELVAFLEANGLTEGNDTPDTPDTPDEPSAGRTDVIVPAGTSRTEEDTTGLGLAFKFDMVVNGLELRDVNVAVLTNATIDALGDGTPCKLIEMGAVMSNDVAVGTRPDRMTLENLSEQTLKIEGERLYTWDLETGEISFAVRIIKIPTEFDTVPIYARSYYIVEIDGQQYTVYGEIVVDNYVGKIDVNDGALDWTNP